MAFAYGYQQSSSKNKSILDGSTLSYFGIPGRGEATRIALTLGGVKFTDERFTFPAFKAKKEAGVFPFGSVPVLTLKNGTKICQSRAIERFVSKLVGLYPSCPVAAAHADAVVDACEDLSEAIMASTRGVDKKSPEFLQKRKEVATTGKLAQSIARLEAFVTKHGSDGFAVGKRLTVADVHIFHVISWLSSGFYDGIPADFADKHARLRSIRKAVGSHKVVAAYYDGKKEASKMETQYVSARDL